MRIALQRFGFFTLLSFILFISSCKIAPVFVSKIEGSKIISLDQKGIKAEIYVRIKNPNNFGFRILKTSFDCELNDMPVGKAHLKKKIRVKANSDDVHTFIVESDFSGLSLKDITKIIGLATAKSVKVHVKGTFKVAKFIFKKEFPFDVTETVKM